MRVRLSAALFDLRWNIGIYGIYECDYDEFLLRFCESFRDEMIKEDLGWSGNGWARLEVIWKVLAKMNCIYDG